MKRVASILVFILAVTFSANAQKMKKHKKSNMSVEQQTSLAVKKMVLNLDLSPEQQTEITPLIAKQMAGKMSMIEARKQAKKTGQRPNADEIYALRSQQLDEKIVLKNNFKQILSKEQFEKFNKRNEMREMKRGKMLKNRKHTKNRKIEKSK